MFERTQIVRNIEARRARFANRFQVSVAPVHRAGVHHSALGEQNELVEKGHNVGTRLMDRQYDRAIVILG